jgi:hypothetical protein
LKYCIIELFEDVHEEMQCVYICESVVQHDFIYTNDTINAETALFDTNDEAVAWGNQNIAPTSHGSNVFRVVPISEKEIFKMRLEG